MIYLPLEPAAPQVNIPLTCLVLGMIITLTESWINEIFSHCTFVYVIVLLFTVASQVLKQEKLELEGYLLKVKEKQPVPEPKSKEVT